MMTTDFLGQGMIKILKQDFMFKAHRVVIMDDVCLTQMHIHTQRETVRVSISEVHCRAIMWGGM